VHTRLHEACTRRWAEEMGIGPQAAEALARADAEVDIAHFPRSPYHMRPVLLLGRDRRGPAAAHHLQQARRAAAAGDCAEALRHLGYGLHALQDQASHGGWWLLGIHWGPWLDRPGPRRLAAVEQASKEYLRTARADEVLRRCLA